jgi:chromate reductase
LKKIKILAIVGSLRKDSYNRKLALIVKELVGDRADFSLLEYGDIPLFNEDIEKPTPEAVRLVYDEVRAADGLWFFTPEYNHFFPGVLKNLLDWISRPQGANNLLSGTPATLSGITPCMTGTAVAQDHLVTLISYLNMDVMNAPRVTVPNALQLLDEEGKLILAKPSLRFLEKQVDGFISFVEKRKA